MGLRRVEVVGDHLLNLDIGLPLEDLRPAVRTAINDGTGSVERAMTAVNRRGRTVEVAVTVHPLRARDSTVAGAVLLME